MQVLFFSFVSTLHSLLHYPLSSLHLYYMKDLLPAYCELQYVKWVKCQPYIPFKITVACPLPFCRTVLLGLFYSLDSHCLSVISLHLWPSKAACIMVLPCVPQGSSVPISYNLASFDLLMLQFCLETGHNIAWLLLE